MALATLTISSKANESGQITNNEDVLQLVIKSGTILVRFDTVR